VGKFCLIALVVILTAIGGVWTWLSRYYVRPFERGVALGDTEAHIVATFGKPQISLTFDSKTREFLKRNGDKINSEIAKTICYGPGDWPIYCINFDTEGRVIRHQKFW